MSLLAHAKKELTLMGEEPDIIKWYLGVLEKFVELEHSGASLEITSNVLFRLMQHKNLTELTNDPEEWTDVSTYPYAQQEKGSLWQSKRNMEAFSTDGGETYYILSERTSDGKEHFYISANKNKEDK